MKKTIILFCSMTLSVCSYGQISVESNGNVGLGITDTPLSPVSIGHNGNNMRMVSIESKKEYGLALTNQNPGAREGVSVLLNTVYTYPKGISSTVNGISSDYGNIVKGIEGVAANGYKNLSVYGLTMPNTNNNAFSAAIYGATTSSYTSDRGTYAGYFAGNVKVTGLVNGYLFSPSTSSGSNGIIQTYSADDVSEDESVAQKLRDIKLLKVRREAISNLTFEAGDSDEIADRLGVSEADCSTYTDGLPKTAFGLAADQLRDVYPELVYEDEQGNLNINYTEMVPLLVQSINELQAKIERLEKGYETAKRAPGMVANAVKTVETEAPALAQNDPNPFTLSTSIAMSIPASVSKATLVIYDMTGKQLRQIEIAERGNTSVTLTSEGLTAGMYLYALIADGQVISTKRMILN